MSDSKFIFIFLKTPLSTLIYSYIYYIVKLLFAFTSPAINYDKRPTVTMINKYTIESFYAVCMAVFLIHNAYLIHLWLMTVSFSNVYID